jgi:micrococcal nuclease
VIVGLIAVGAAAVAVSPFIDPPTDTPAATGRPTISSSKDQTIVPTAQPSATPQLPVVQPDTCRVARVVDGDTVRVQCGAGEIAVRLIGIDTPETVDPRKPVQCWGAEASQLAHQLLDGKTVKMSTDPSQGAKDRYLRTLAYLSVGGRDFGEQMLERGAAREYTYDTPYALKSRYSRAQRLAQARNAGLWGNC